MLPNLAFSSVSTQPLLCSRLLSSSKTFLKEMWRRLEKERGREDPEDMRPSTAGRGEEAVWTLRQTDGGAQSRRPTVLLQLPQDGFEVA